MEIGQDDDGDLGSYSDPNSWAGHEHKSLESDNVYEFPPSHDFDTQDPYQAPVFANNALRWRPFYLHRRVLAAFAALFTILLAGLVAIYAVSNNNTGLTATSTFPQYLRTYGPTFLLTLVAAGWSRASYQSKMMAPWVQMANHPARASRTLLLDYISMFQPYVVWVSLRNSHFMVAAIEIVAILLKVLVVLSSSLITLEFLQVSLSSVPITIQDCFVDDLSRLQGLGSLPYYVMEGLISNNLTWPPGTSEDYAFQTIQPVNLNIGQISVIVDALANSLICESVSLTMTGVEPPDPRSTTAVMNLTLASPDCNMKVSPLGPEPVDGTNTSVVTFARLASGQCDGTSDDAGKRILVMFGLMNYTTDYSKNTTDYEGFTTHPIEGTLLKSTQILCSPAYTMTRVTVVQNGTQASNVTQVPGAANTTLGSLESWDIMEAHFNAYDNDISEQDFTYPTSVNVSQTVVDADPYMSIMLGSLPPDTQAADLYNQTMLESVAGSYYRLFGAVVAQQALKEPASIPTTGSALTNENRLVVQSAATEGMAAVLGACILMTIAITFLAPREGILPRNPSTLTGLAALFSTSRGLLDRLREAGSADEKGLRRALNPSTYQAGVVYAGGDPISPQPYFTIFENQTQPREDDTDRLNYYGVSKKSHPLLHPGLRQGLFIVLVGIIITLEFTLRHSEAHDGLGDAGSNGHIHYFWTGGPAIVFGILTLVFSATDLRVRALTPYSTLKKPITAQSFISLDLLDKSFPRILYQEVRHGNYGALAMTVSVLVASLFTSFAGSLFQAVPVPTTIPVAMRAATSFSCRPTSIAGGAETASLILESNLTYPAFTYEDMAFPTFNLTTPLPERSGMNTSSFSIQAVVPALRPQLTCRIYDSSSITTNLTLNYSTFADEYTNPLGIIIDGEPCYLKPDDEIFKYNVIMTTRANASYFGVGDATQAALLQGCSSLLYIWGSLNYSMAPHVPYVSAMGCNQTYGTLDVNTTFFGSTFEIDPQVPPVPISSTARPSTIDLEYDTPLVYIMLATVPSTDLLDPFFGLLTTSLYAIPVEALGDSTQASAVDRAIRFQHGIIQTANLSPNRVPANASNATLVDPPPKLTDAGGNDAEPLYNATFTVPNSRRRIVQDPTSTRVLQALLGAALALSLIGWALIFHKGAVLARSPTTIASAAALLAGGNVLELLPAGAAWLSEDELMRALSGGSGPGGAGMRFLLGWGRVPDVDGKAVGGENENGISRFGIFAVGASEIQSTAYQPAPIMEAESSGYQEPSMMCGQYYNSEGY